MSLTAAEVEARRTTIGASDVPVILGLSKWKTARELYLEKTSTGPALPSPDSEASTWGHRLEGVILEAWGFACGVHVQPWRVGAVEARDIPWATCTPDGWVRVEETGQSFGVEVKNRAYGSNWGPSDTLEIPPDVEAQVRWSMFVMNVDQWGVGVLLGGNNFRHYLIHRDKEWEEWVFPIVEAFRAGADVDGSAWKPLSASGVMRTATKEEEDILQEYIHFKAMAAGLEEGTNTRMKLLKEKIGSDRGIVAADVSVSWLPVAGRKSIEWQLVANRLEEERGPGSRFAKAVEACTVTGKPYRRLVVKGGSY